MKHENLQPTQFHYIKLNETESIYNIQFDLEGFVEIIGDGSGYEWLIWEEGVLTTHSNVGYGESAMALRDGLNKALPGTAKGVVK